MFRVIYDDNVNVDLTDESDVAYVQGNNDTVRGGLGDDWLATALRGSGAVLLETTLFGRRGGDTLHAAVRFGGDWDGVSESGVAVTLDGGSGNDEIQIRTESVLSTDEIIARGGSGEDAITIESRYVIDPDLGYPNSFDYHGANVNVEGGSGSDMISVFVQRPSSGRTIIDAGTGHDIVSAEGATNEIHGGTGNDKITAVAGVSFDWGDEGLNEVHGGAGNDELDLKVTADGGANLASGGDGNDTLKLVAGGTTDLSNRAYGDAGDDNLLLDLTAGGWADRARGSNEARGGEGSDVIKAVLELVTGSNASMGEELPESGLNVLYGNGGDDRLTASVTVDNDSALRFARSELYGGAGNDRLKVSGGDGNLLYGNLDNDTLLGGNGSDRLTGGQGADYLRGNGGEDVFVFEVARGTSKAERDRIADFTIGEDLIDISKIDAKSWKSGNQAFVFDEHGTGKSGTVWVEDATKGHGSVVYANTGKALLAVDLLDGRGVDAHDYSAGDFIL